MNLWLRVFLPFAAGYYFSYFLRNVNAVIAPELTRELGVSAADLAQPLLQVVIGEDRFGIAIGVIRGNALRQGGNREIATRVKEKRHGIAAVRCSRGVGIAHAVGC